MKRVTLLMLLFLFFSCEAWDRFNNRLRIKNNSSNRIYVKTYYTYPDTLLNENSSSPIISKLSHEIMPGKINVYGITNTWEKIFEDLPKDTLMVFVFDGDTLEQSGWEEVKANYKILKRYDVSYEDLKNNDWTIEYE